MFVVPVRFNELLVQTGVLLDAVAVGLAFTVTLVVTELLHPPETMVYVIVVEPAATAVTTPVVGFTVATLGLLLVQEKFGNLTITIPEPPLEPLPSPPPPPPPVLFAPADCIKLPPPVPPPPCPPFPAP
jgi:hypothetical protein